MKNICLILFAILLSLILITSCRANDDTVKSINYTQFKELVALNDKVTIIDVREVDEYMVECIPNTLLFPVQFIKSNYEVLNKSRIYVIICEKGGRSLDVSEFLARKGFSNIFNFEGGIKKWSGNLLKTCAPNVDLPLSTSLEDVDGEQFLLNDLINNGPTIIYFFDVNNDDTDIKLLSLQNINKIQNSNLSIIALYSDNFTKGLVIKRELGLEYYVVNDKSGELIQELSNNSKTDNSVFETFFMFDGSERIYRFDIEELDQVINYIK